MKKIGNYVSESEKGQANGVAELDGTGKVPAAQIPSSGNFADSNLTFDGDREHELDSHKLTFKGRLTGTSDRIDHYYNSSIGIPVTEYYDRWGTRQNAINIDNAGNYVNGVSFNYLGLDIGPNKSIQLRRGAGPTSYMHFSDQWDGAHTKIGANVPHYFLAAAGALATNKFIVGENSAVGSESISLQGSTLIKGEGTSTGSTLALYDNDTTPYKRFEILDNGQFRLDSSNAVVATPFKIEMRPLGGTGTPPYFMIKNYGEVEIYGGLSNLFNVQNTLGAKQFEVLNGTTKINGASQINSTWFQVLTDTQKMSFNAGSGGALHHEIKTNGGGGPITTKFNIPGGGYQFIVGPSAIIGTEKISLQGDTLIDGSLDMNNNRIKKAVINPSVQEAANAATFTINSDQETDGVLTAMSANTTIAAPTGTPVQSQSLIFRFKDDGSARTLTWNAIFRAIGVTLPTTTTASKLLYVGCKYNSTDTKWDVVSVQEEA